VYDAALVRRFERIRELRRNLERLVDRDASVREALGERRPLDQLHHEARGAAAALEAVNVPDVRVTQRGERLRFLLEARHSVRIGREGGRQHLDRDVAPQSGIAGAIYLAHAAGANQTGDLIRSEPRTGRDRHRFPQR